MKLFGIVFFYLCVILLDASLAYKAAILHNNDISAKEFTSFVHEIGKENVDILVLPSAEWRDNLDNFEARITKISKVASQAGLYIVATLLDSASCRNDRETVKTNLVFNRKGDIVSDYRKPVSKFANCTSAPTELVTFTTDFGVVFGLLMDEDILLHDVGYMKGVKNFVMTDAKEENTLSGAKLSSSWSYVNGVNMISSNGIYSAKSGLKTGSGKLVVAEIDTNGVSENPAVPVIKSNSFTGIDFSQYAIKPLDLVASAQGYKETVCQQSFCCEYFVKTADEGLKTEVSYNLAAFDGVLPVTPHQYVGVQTCAMFVAEKESSGQRSAQSNIVFEKITVAANFSKNNVQYPIIESTTVLPTEKFRFETNTNDILKQVTLGLSNVNVASVGIFGRDFSKDFDGTENNNSENTYDILFNEDIQEIFDYIWIRLRILIFVVSIYVLEMM